ncbi:MAG TPA: TauD/TfdA family dioxygenase [Steroidobacteraceae bacterium]|nr:TauD/TfdA family dioxygenase [Steroidobacteraceae bacterium]
MARHTGADAARHSAADLSNRATAGVGPPGLTQGAQRPSRSRFRRRGESKYSPRELRPLSEQSARQVPPPGIHPLVRTHPENRRKALYLNPVRIEGIVGMADEEALDLVAGLMTHATQNKYEYRHQWRYGDLVIWDNRSVIHKANPDYDMNKRRYLYRLMLKGETPV